MNSQRIWRESGLDRHFQVLLRRQISRPLVGILILFVVACAGSNTPTPIAATSATSDTTGQTSQAFESIEAKDLSNRPLPTLRDVVRRVAVCIAIRVVFDILVRGVPVLFSVLLPPFLQQACVVA